jgi:chemosensory pili system protein ChpC
MNQSAAAEILSQRVNCLLLPVKNKQLLVPVSTIAEVVNPLFKPDEKDATPESYGTITWREQEIPLLSYEGINGEAKLDWILVSRVAVFNAIEDGISLGFYGLALSGIPHPLQVADDSKLTLTKSDKAGDPLMSYEGDGLRGVVPDFVHLEKIAASHKGK